MLLQDQQTLAYAINLSREIHYLQSLTPIPTSEGPFVVVAEPTPAWIAIPRLIVVTAIVLFLAGLRIRRMEISYGSD